MNGRIIMIKLFSYSSFYQVVRELTCDELFLSWIICQKTTYVMSSFFSELYAEGSPVIANLNLWCGALYLILSLDRYDLTSFFLWLNAFSATDVSLAFKGYTFPDFFEHFFFSLLDLLFFVLPVSDCRGFSATLSLVGL